MKKEMRRKELSIIPSKTMISIMRENSSRSIPEELNIRILVPSRFSRSSHPESSVKFKGKVYKKPREWRYITKPFFKRFKEPMVDVFEEAQEVQVIIDLGNFRKGEMSFGLKDKKYVIYGKHKDCEFKEEIPLPYNVDIERIKEIFRNDILQIVLPRREPS